MKTKTSYDSTRKSGRKIGATIVFLLAVVAAGLVLWWYYGHTNKMANDLSTPPAQQSQKRTIPNNAQQLKNSQSGNTSTTGSSSATNSSSSSPSSSTSTSTSGKTKVTPTINTYTQTSSAVNVNGGVDGIVESGGTCTLKFTNGGKTVTTTKSGFVSGTSTTCGQMSVPYGTGNNEVSKGTWQVTLSYSSSDAYGTSSPTSMAIN